MYASREDLATRLLRILAERVEPRLLVVVSYLFVLPLGGFAVYNVGSRGVQPAWVLGVLVAAWFLWSLGTGRAALPRDRVHLAFAGVFGAYLATGLSPVLSGDGGRITDYLTTFLPCAVSMAVFLAFTTGRFSLERAERVLVCYLILGGLMALLAVVQFAYAYAYGGPLHIPYTNGSWEIVAQRTKAYQEVLGPFLRSSGLFKEPRQCGAFLIGPLAILFKLVLTGRRLSFRSIFPIVILFTVVAAGLVCTLSMSAILIAGVVLVAILLVFVWQEVDYRAVATAGLVLVVVGGLTVTFTDIEEQRYWRRFTPPDAGDMVQILRELPEEKGMHGFRRYFGNMSFALDVFREHPLTGVGLNNLENFSRKGWIGCHQPFMLVAEGGLVGVIAMGTFIVLFASSILRLRRQLPTGSRSARGQMVLLDVALILVALAPVKGAASLYNYYNTFFWFDLTLAGILFYSVLPAKVEA